MEIGPEDNGATLTARVGERITLRLPEIPTTGFRWRPELPENSGADLSDETYVGPEEPRGAPGQHQFDFLAARPGVTGIRLVKERSWEGKPADEFVVTLDVQPA